MTPLNPSSIKTRFAYRFVRTLKRLNKNRQTTSKSTPREIFRRYRMVKMASDASMASAVGPRRAWSRAVIWKIRKRSYGGLMRRRSRGGERNISGKGFGGISQTDQLRRLVPGGEAMDLCSLLGETAHYIKCLTTQVQVMRNVVNFYSTT